MSYKHVDDVGSVLTLEKMDVQELSLSFNGPSTETGHLGPVGGVVSTVPDHPLTPNRGGTQGLSYVPCVER